MKTHYELLALERTAPPDEVKRAFRREIARYHPDKVQHLGTEFQQIAATRAAELTEAYRVLMDVELRRGYDESLLEEGAAAPPPPSPPPNQQQPLRDPAPSKAGSSTVADAAPSPAGQQDTQFKQERATSVEFLRRAVLAKFTEAVQAVGGEPTSKAGFDAAYRITTPRALFSKADPPITVLLRVGPVVDAQVIQEAWMPAMRGATVGEAVCLLLLGSGMAPAKDLSRAISEQRRRARQAGPVVIPVDMRDWEALFPPDTPSIVRTLLERLRSGR